MNRIKEILLADGNRIYVEMEEIDLPSSIAHQTVEDLPDGAELTSVTSKTLDAVQILQNTLKATVDTIYSGIKDSCPDEWSVELNIGFKGKNSPVPVILSGEANVGVKVIAKWKKSPTT